MRYCILATALVIIAPLVTAFVYDDYPLVERDVEFGAQLTERDVDYERMLKEREIDHWEYLLERGNTEEEIADILERASDEFSVLEARTDLNKNKGGVGKGGTIKTVKHAGRVTKTKGEWVECIGNCPQGKCVGPGCPQHLLL